MTLRLHAGSENSEHRSVRASQLLGRHRGCGGGPHLGDKPAVQDRERLARLGLEHHDEGVVGVDPDVLRIERDELGAEGPRVRRHDGEETVMGSNGEHAAHRLHDLARRQVGERLRDGGNEVLVVEPLLDGRLVEDIHHMELRPDGCLHKHHGTPSYSLGGCLMIPMNTIVPDNFSRSAKRNGRSTRSATVLDRPMTTAVTAAAVVPSSLTSTYVLCLTSVIYPPVRKILVKSAREGENAIPIPNVSSVGFRVRLFSSLSFGR